MAEKLDMHTKDLPVENVDRIAELFPSCATESLKDGKQIRSIDFDALKQEPSDFVVEGPTERYRFTWPDRSKTEALDNKAWIGKQPRTKRKMYEELQELKSRIE